MIVDLTQNDLAKQMELNKFFSSPMNVTRALVLAKVLCPQWYYEDVKEELMKCLLRGCSRPPLSRPSGRC